MGLDIADLATNTATCQIDVMGETANVVYRPAAITTERIERIDKRAKPTPGEERDTTDQFVSFFVDVIEDWDITKNKRKVPITPEALTALPLFLLRIIFMGLMKETGSGESGKASSSGSRPKDHLAPARSGTKSSKRRGTSA
jgi:hypothetical protein